MNSEITVAGVLVGLLAGSILGFLLFGITVFTEPGPAAYTYCEALLEKSK